MIDHADLCILETMTDEMTPIERQCVEQVRELFDALEEATDQVENWISPDLFADQERRADDAREALEIAEQERDQARSDRDTAEEERDKARDLAEERSKEIDELRAKLATDVDLRQQLAEAEAREDGWRTKAGESRAALESILREIETKLEAVTS